MSRASSAIGMRPVRSRRCDHGPLGSLQFNMWIVRILFVLISLQVGDFSDLPCVIELECAECVPENMPLVTSHRAANGSVRVPPGEELALECAGGAFLLYPQAEALRPVCEAGRYRVPLDRALRHILELGCQESVFEDVLHQVEHCGPPLQGRAYLARQAGGVRHLATVCYDEDRALAVRLHAAAALALPPHAERSAPLSILGNFNHMFDANTRRDAERLYSDDVRLNRRLRELFKHEGSCFAAQALTAAALLPGPYFEERFAPAAQFASNRVASWRSIVEGNLRHLQRDVGAVLRAHGAALQLHVQAGTHGVLALRTDAARAAVFLKGGGRFPVPKYIWTVLHSRSANRGIALVLLNDPLVTVSDIREAVFCESACGAVGWLRRLRRHRNYERPAAGLVFCCTLQAFADRVTEMPNIFNATVAMLNEVPIHSSA